MINGPSKVDSPSNAVAPTPLQQACIMRSLLSPANGHYIQQLVCEWAEPLQINAWKRAWDFVAGRHDALRACFQWHHADGVTQHFADTITAPLEVMRDIPPDADRIQVMSSFLGTDRTCGFNLASAPLWRLTVFLWNDREATTVWTFHHSLLDGRSHTLVWQEVNTVYCGLLEGKVPVLPPARSFREFTAWLTARPVAAAAAYWRERLHGIRTAPAPSAQDYGNDNTPPAMDTLSLTPAATTRLREAARRHNVTPNNLVQAAWALALSQSQTVEEIIFGVVRSGRHWTDEDPNGRVGMFINTIPFRVNTSTSQQVGAWLQGLRAQQLAARDGEHASVEQIRRWCGLPGSAVLFRTLLMFEDRDSSELLTNATQRAWLIEKPDLPSLAAFAGTVLTLNLKYSPRRHSPVQARTVLEQIQAFLEALASASGDLLLGQLAIRLPEDCRLIFDEWQGRSTAQPDQLHCVLEVQGDSSQRAAEIPLLTEAERHQILIEWNRTDRDYPRDKCIHQLFEEQVGRTPDAVAVVFEGNSLSYRELNIRSNQLAHHLRGLGVGPDVFVGLCVERSLEMVVALLGILKAGGAYWALEENLPAERIGLMFADARPRVLLVRRSSFKHLSRIGDKAQADLTNGTVTITAIEDLLESSSEATILNAPPNKAGDPAYVSYTSGSTGQPKGVVVPHRGVVRLVKGTDYVSFSPAETLLHLSPLSFDASTFEIWGALLNGGRLVLLRPGPPTPAEIGEAIRQQGVTTLWLTAGLFHLMVDERLDDLKPLRQLLAGGDVLSPEHMRKARRSLTGCRIINGYGPTENTTFTCCYPVEDERELIPSVPIGRPIANTRVYVLDSHLHPVPVGVAGELYAGGDGVACGYLHQPQLTAERFIPDPFSDKLDARLYRTGDLARWRPDGNLEFLGRLDSQVKIRGFRIELGEVEGVLRAQSEIRKAAVVVREDTPGDKRLVAYLVAKTGEKPDAIILRARLAEKLPDYMIPSRFVAVEAMPLNANGKLDRKALEMMDGEELASGTDYVAPRNELERELAEIWRAVLRRERVGIQDNFFDLGGHSLLAAVMGSQIHRRLGKEVSLHWIFEHPTIERLAKRLAATEGQRQNLHPIAKADRKKPLLMSFAQQRMWLLRQTLPDPATYNLAVAWRLSGRVDLEKVRRALMAILERHEVLRTALVQTEGNLMQQITGANGVSLPWQEVDLRIVPPNQKEEILAGRLLEEARRPFDLGQAPLWRVVWVHLGEEEQVLAFTFHHCVMDEWSMRLCIQELERFYAADGQIEPAGLPVLPVQYADYAAWQRQRLTGKLLERQQAYWREQLRDLPPALELSTNRTRSPRPSGRGAVHDFQLTGTVVTRLRELARQEGTTLFTTMLAACHVWLHRYSGQTDVVVGTPLAKRERSEVQALLGFFLNTLPIRVRLDGSSSFRAVLHQVRQSLFGAFRHADLPFEQMVELVVKEREPGQQPLYQVMFILLEEGLPSLHLDQAQSRPVPMGTGTSKNDLTLNIEAAAESWDCKFEYATDLFNAETIARMARHFAELLRSLTDDPGQPISRLQLMPEPERHQILVEWNRTERDYPRDKCVHQLFEEQAERTPDAVAVEFDGNSLSYRELNNRSNQLAHHLISLGVGPDVLVGLCVERSLEMVVALLGILKAGGAYVPLDPALPQQRLAFMLEDTALTVLLTQRRVADCIGHHSARVVWLDEFVWQPGPENPPHPGPSSSLAYVIYTSGSTGQPKGVEISHQALVNCLCHFQRSLDVRPDDRCLAITTLSFDIAGLELWLPLVAGARVILASRETIMDGRRLNQDLTDHAVTILQATPVTWQALLHSGWQGNPKLQILCGGEAMPQKLADRLAVLGSRAWNVYGPTETTIWSTTRQLVPNCPVNIGGPLANTQVYILDSHRQPMPIGLIGELFIGGDSVARGYHNRPELTAERFVPDPFSAWPGARLYKTGDLARWLPDGNIEFLGRGDHQVKIRGHRIELGEIEAVLGGHPEVAACAVVAPDHLGENKILVAFVVGREQAKPAVDTLRQWLKEKLPDYMVPARFVTVPALPLNPNGKVDRKTLLTLETSAGDAPSVTSQPINLLELELIRIWRRLFRRENIGRHDNFFALGGHSLLAARLAAEIDKLLKCKLPIAALFQSPTIESLARRLADENWAPPWSSLVPLQPLGSKPPLFFVHGWGGDVYCFLELIKLLPPDQPCYGVQAVGLDGKSARHATVEEMAAHYVKEITSFQPDGAFYLTGYSLGGLIAFEIARQLHRLGRRVALLGLFDSAPIGPIPRILYGLSLASYIPERCLSHFRNWWQLPRHERFNYLRGRWVALRFWMEKNLSKPPPVTAPPRQNSQPPQVPGFKDYYVAVAFAYRLRPYPGSADVFCTDDSNETYPGWKWWYWRYFARGGVSYHRVPGGHMQILFSPAHLPELAKSLTTALHRAQEKERADSSRNGHPHANPVS
jgi:amino acid adenylation domain-containing protein